MLNYNIILVVFLVICVSEIAKKIKISSLLKITLKNIKNLKKFFKQKNFDQENEKEFFDCIFLILKNSFLTLIFVLSIVIFFEFLIKQFFYDLYLFIFSLKGCITSILTLILYSYRIK